MQDFQFENEHEESKDGFRLIFDKTESAN